MQVLKTQLAAKKEGYADVVYLDAKTDTYLEEVSSCNIFTVQGNTIRTPPIEVCGPQTPCSVRAITSAKAWHPALDCCACHACCAATLCQAFVGGKPQAACACLKLACGGVQLRVCNRRRTDPWRRAPSFPA